MKSSLSSIDSFLQKINNRIEKNIHISDETSSFFRIILSLNILLFFCPDYTWISEIPETLYNPLYFNISRIYGNFPPKWYLVITSYISLISIMFIGIGLKTRFFSRLYAILLIINAAFIYSFGKIDHGILLPVTLLCLSFSNWGTCYAVAPDKASSLHLKSYQIVALCLIFGMFSAGLGKLIVWLDFDLSTNGFLSWFYQRYFSLGSRNLLANTVFYFPRILVESFDYIAIVFELSPLYFLLKSKKHWLLWLIVAILFHITNTLLLNIPFWANGIIYFSFIIGHYKLKISSRLTKTLHYLVISFFVIILIERLFLGINKSYLFLDLSNLNIRTTLTVALILWIILFFIALNAMFKKKVD